MKQIDELLWDTFTKSGQAGYYMLMNAINNSEEERQQKK